MLCRPEEGYRLRQIEQNKVYGLNHTILSADQSLSWQQYKMGLDARKPVFSVCEQRRSRPACALGQTDQHLCYSLFGKYHIWTCYKWNFIFLSSLCSWTGWFESHFVWNPEDRFLCVETQIMTISSSISWNLIITLIDIPWKSVYADVSWTTLYPH